MGGFLDLTDIIQGDMAKKVSADKRHGGLDAPRNSLEIPIKPYETYYAIEDNTPCTYPMKLINEEISKKPKSSKFNSPGLVARLMGVDTLPLNTKLVSPQAEKNYEKSLTEFQKEKHQTKNSSNYDARYTLEQIKLESFHNNQERDPDSWGSHANCKRSRPQEHPQEEELQKFKKEFEAFQAARLKECSKVVELGTVTSQWIAQENLHKEKTAIYANSARKSTGEKSKELEGNFVKSKIVILRTGPDKIGIETKSDSRASSSSSYEDKGNMEEFLDEVKERLKCEIQGKSLRGNIVRGGGIETPFTKKLSSPKNFAQQIAKNDGKLNLKLSTTGSYSARSCTNESMSRDTRRFLSERLQYVLKKAVNDERSRSFGSTTGRCKLDKFSCSNTHGFRCRSFRCEPENDEMSPSDLVRSFSAPVSEAALGKTLLEHRYVSNGALIKKQSESIERVIVKTKNQRKERFSSLREKVSSLKHNFTLGGKRFGKKIQSVEESFRTELDFVRNVMSEPTLAMNLGSRYENYTEVPPSPASLCSSIHEDYWRPLDNLSPTSSSNLPSSPLFFKDISSNLNELRKQLYQLDDESDDTTIHNEQSETDMPELEDQTESYIRDLLIASGLYDGLSDKSISRWDPFPKYISSLAFEEVESSFTKKNRSLSVDHNILLDLLNEVLPSLLEPPLTTSKFKKKGAKCQPPRGGLLLDLVWEVVRVYVYPVVDRSNYSLDHIVRQDFLSSPWSSGYLSDNLDALGKEIEGWIIRDLIDDIAKDIQLH